VGIQSVRLDQGLVAERISAEARGQNGAGPQPEELLCRGGTICFQSG